MLYYTVTCKSSTSLQMELLLIWWLYFVLTNARIHSSSSLVYLNLNAMISTERKEGYVGFMVPLSP